MAVLGASANTIGGLAPGAGNVVAFNGGAGIRVADGARGNTILANAVFANGGGSHNRPIRCKNGGIPRWLLTAIDARTVRRSIRFLRRTSSAS